METAERPSKRFLLLRICRPVEFHQSSDLTRDTIFDGTGIVVMMKPHPLGERRLVKKTLQK